MYFNLVTLCAINTGVSLNCGSQHCVWLMIYNHRYDMKIMPCLYEHFHCVLSF